MYLDDEPVTKVAPQKNKKAKAAPPAEESDDDDDDSDSGKYENFLLVGKSIVDCPPLGIWRLKKPRQYEWFDEL